MGVFLVSPLAAGARPLERMVRQRVRIRFRKQGDLRWIGHRDLARALERLFRRAGLALGMSEGYHPKPRMSFPSALAVGIEGLDEVLEVELAEAMPAESLAARLNAHAPPGLQFTAVEWLPPQARKAQLRSATYEIAVPADRQAETAQRIERLLAEPAPAALRPDLHPHARLRASIEDLRLGDGVLQMRLVAGAPGSAGPRDVLAALGLEDLLPQGARLVRSRVELQP